MSTQSGRAPTLATLPQDVTVQILERMAPRDIARYGTLCRSTAASAADPLVWAAAARRCLGVARHDLTPAAVRALAAMLVCRWSVATGLLVPGVAVHFRKGFSDIRARGGVEVPVEEGGALCCYVVGDERRDHVVRVPVPRVEMDFSLVAAGPFPMAGMVLRVVHGSEAVSAADARHRASVGAQQRAAEHPTLTPQHLDLGPPHFATMHSAGGERDVHMGPTEARVSIKLNNITVVDKCAPEGFVFSTLDVPLPPDILRTKPRMNTLVIEYHRSSTAPYWLKEVQIVPAILPLPPVETPRQTFTVGPVDRPTKSADMFAPHAATVADPTPAPEPAHTRHSAPRESRSRHPNLTATKPSYPCDTYEQRQQNHHQKHYYHYNRKPRRSAPLSPRSRRV